MFAMTYPVNLLRHGKELFEDNDVNRVHLWKPISIQHGRTHLYNLTFLILNLQGVSKMLEQTSRMSFSQQKTEEHFFYKLLSGNE